MTDFKAWIPPAGAVVDPPVHPKTTVLPIFSDGSNEGDPYRAEQINWSAEGDGPRVVAYAIVEEYKPAPKVAREWWINVQLPYAKTAVLHETYEAADEGRRTNDGKIARGYEAEPTHVREVPQGREVVTWVVVDDRDGDTTPCDTEENAACIQRKYGGTVVKLTGVMPNE